MFLSIWGSDFTKKSLGNLAAEIIPCIIFVVVILSFAFVLGWVIGFFIKSYRLKKFFRRFDWSKKFHYAFYKEGFLVDSFDMQGIFYWDDLAFIDYCSDAVVFIFCPVGTEAGDFFKYFYPELDPFFLFVDDDPKIYELLNEVSKNYKKLVRFKKNKR